MPEYLVTVYPARKKKQVIVERYRDEEITTLTEKPEIKIEFILKAKTKAHAILSAGHASKKVVNAILEERKKKDK